MGADVGDVTDKDMIDRAAAKAAVFAVVQERADREGAGLMSAQLAKRAYGNALDAVPAATPSPDAAAMRTMAVEEIASLASPRDIPGGCLIPDTFDEGTSAAKAAILALPEPDEADRLAEALRLPEVAALVEAVKAEIMARQLYENTMTDRGGAHGPKGLAFSGWQSAIADLFAALRALTGEGE